MSSVIERNKILQPCETDLSHTKATLELTYKKCGVKNFLSPPKGFFDYTGFDEFVLFVDTDDLPTIYRRVHACCNYWPEVPKELLVTTQRHQAPYWIAFEEEPFSPLANTSSRCMTATEYLLYFCLLSVVNIQESIDLRFLDIYSQMVFLSTIEDGVFGQTIISARYEKVGGIKFTKGLLTDLTQPVVRLVDRVSK